MEHLVSIGTFIIIFHVVTPTEKKDVTTHICQEIPDADPSCSILVLPTL
jgi:hypothetical protein